MQTSVVSEQCILLTPMTSPAVLYVGGCSFEFIWPHLLNGCVWNQQSISLTEDYFCFFLCYGHNEQMLACWTEADDLRWWQ